MDSAVGQSLTHQDNLKSIHLLKVIVQSSLGPNGKCKMLQNACGGHVTITSVAKRLLKVMKVTNPVLKIIVSAADSHLRCHENDALTLMLVILELLSRSLKLQIPQRIVLDTCHKLKQAVLAHLQECALRVKIDFDNLKLPILLMHSILGSKPACCLTRKQRDHISLLLIRGFLNTIPKNDNSNSRIGNLHFVSLPGLSPDHCQLLDGLLIESIDSKLPDLPSGALKCALFHVSLSGDIEGGLTEETWHLQANVNVVESCTTLILDMLGGLLSDGVAVVACQKVVHPRAKKYLQNHGVLVLDRLGLLSFGALTELAGGDPFEKVVGPLDPSCFGMLDAISLTTLHKKTYYHLLNHHSNVSTLLLHNYHEESLEELKHVCHQGINGLQELLQYPFILCGGGCLETHLAGYIRCWGKENMPDLMKNGATIGQVSSIIKAFARSLESVAASLAKCETEMLAVGANCHLWYPLESLSYVNDILPGDLQQCSCGAVNKQAADPGFVLIQNSGALLNTDTKLTESPLLEIQRNSLLVVDGALSKQDAIKTALEIFITILNVDLIIQKT